MQQLLVIALAVTFFAVFWYLKRPTISPAAAHALVAEGATLVDVRTPSEFVLRHLDGARNIPVGEIAQRTAEIMPSDRPVVIYCASGARSALAARALKRAGFTRVYNLGAISNW